MISEVKAKEKKDKLKKFQYKKNIARELYLLQVRSDRGYAV